jgi:D-alanyl-D-alanine carboxypeptidase/D-alanyl-D-alanine-endopeptidase (penicillin-binding protein 4)
MQKSRFLPRLALLLIPFSLARAIAQELKPPATLPELQERLTDHLAQPKFAAALWGVKVVALDSGKTLFEHNPGKLFSPASNSKLYTVALALDRLGADYQIRTSLYAAARPSAGTLKGDLVVYGRGDPTLAARLHGSNIFAALQPLVSALTNGGVKRITGDLVADTSFFHGPEFGSGWAWDDLESYYGAEISPLTINDNALPVMVKPGEKAGARCGLSVGAGMCGADGPSGTPALASFLIFSNRTETVEAGQRRTISFYRPLNGNIVYVSGRMPKDGADFVEDVPVHNPAGLFLVFFKEALARAGIKVGGKLRTADWLERQVHPLDCGQMVEVGFMESPPLNEVAREIEKPSQNLYTDLLLAHVGETLRARNGSERGGAAEAASADEVLSRETSESKGIRELNRFLAEVGIARGQVLFEEGSGLSRNNLTTPNATVALLQFMSRHKCASAYLDALPIAGVDGTLKSRMKGTVAAGNARAKTGTLRWANSLSGYVTTASGQRLVFSLMLNRYQAPGPGNSARADLDAIVEMLAGYKGQL